MEVLKETKEYTVFKKRSGRYAIKASDGKWLNGVEKIKILNKEGYVKGGLPGEKKSEPVEEAPKAEVAEEVSSEEEPTEENKEK